MAPVSPATARDVVAVVVLLGLLCDLISDLKHCSYSTYTNKIPLLITQLRLIAASAFIALLSVHEQAVGIIGVSGLLPLKETLMPISTLVDSKDEGLADSSSSSRSFMARIKASLGCRSLNVFMMKVVLLFMKPCAASDRTLIKQVRTAIFVSIVAMIMPHPVCFAYLYLFYFAIKRAFGKFMNLQWDLLLLETLLLSSFTSLVPVVARDHSYSWSRRVTTALCLGCYKFLLFRLMFGSGVVKILSGDRTWNELTAMSFHFQTQPLPNRVAPLLHRLPIAVLKAITLLSLVAETIVPVAGLFAGMLPAQADYGLCLAVLTVYVCLQASIMTSGHFGYFNGLSLALGTSLLARIDMQGGFDAIGPASGLGDMSLLLVCGTVWSLVAAVYLYALYNILVRYGLHESSIFCHHIQAPAAALHAADKVIAASKVLMIGNHYGLFANMTRARYEVVIEASIDGQSWQTIHFKYKPSDETSPLLPPLWLSPPLHMPRLDWEMWFFGLQAHRIFISSGGRNCAVPLPPWMTRLLLGISSGEESVLGLLDSRRNNLALSMTRFIRMTLYSFEFSDEEGATKLRPWKRLRLGEVLASTPVERLRAMATPQEQQQHIYTMGDRPMVETKDEIIARTLRKLATGGMR